MHKFDELNRDFVAKSEQVVKTVLIALIPVGAIIDVVAWRRRELAELIYYYDLLVILIHGFIPFEYGDFMNFTLFTVMFQAFISTASYLSRNAICSAFVHAVVLLVAHPIVYNQAWSFGMVFHKIWSVFFSFSSLVMMSMLITYIA